MTRKISAIVCTYNGAAMLPGALDSLVHQSLPADQYEIVVVDNASTDGTRQVVEEYLRRSSVVRYVYEAKQGLSAARNRGVKEARSDIIAFIDDDAIADERWLEEHCRAYETEPGLSAVGGRIELAWLAPRPSWLYSELEIGYGKFALEPAPTLLDFPLFPFGSNFSAIRNAFVEVGGFSEHLGRKGKHVLGGEEREFFYRLSLLNARVFYQPKALVWHRVPAERLSRAWMLKLKFAVGVSSAIYNDLVSDNTGRLQCFMRGVQAGFRCVVLMVKIPLAAIFRGHRAKNLPRLAASVCALGRCYQNMRMAAQIGSGYHGNAR
jgi:glycosyltransferase involved in cell wall biosynthesis